MKYKYPRDAVEALFKSSSPEVLDRLFPIKTPRYLVQQLAEIAYHASFLIEEGRPTRFQLALLSRDRVPRTGLDHEMTVLEFQKPRPLSVVEVLRLAPATDFTTTLICVDAMMNMPGIAHRGLEIWGVVSAGTSSKRLLRLQTAEAVHVPTCLVVSSAVPGQIQLALNIRPLVILRSGTVSVVPREADGLPEPILKLLEQGILSSTEEIFKNQLGESCESALLEQIVRNKYIEVFCKILLQLSESCHGLTLLFIPQAALTSVNEIISIKYSTHCERIGLVFRGYILEYFRSSTEKRDTTALSRLEGLLSETIRAISAASAVDGALIITDRFDVIGFGAEIKANDSQVEKLNFTVGRSKTRYLSRSVTEFGTRHRSAARFTKALPGTIAFIISQDGDRKIMTSVNGDVVVWSNVVWDRIWETLTT
jgi:hypothetical protein